MVLDQGERHDQRHEAAPVVVDQVRQLGALGAVQLALEEASQVLQHVRVPRARGPNRERLHQERAVLHQASAEPDAADKIRELEALHLDGYVLKRASPSCGLFRVRVYHPNGIPQAGGRGIFAQELARRLPMLPVEEEGRLTDPSLRENFIERVFAAARWRAFVGGRPRTRDLVAFHAAEKFAILAHSPTGYGELGRLVAKAGRILTRDALDQYGRLLMEARTARATRARHANVLQHLAGFFKRQLGPGERAELVEVIEDYRAGLIPLVVPITLIRHHVRRFEVAYLANQTYLNPHPKELMLRNHVEPGGSGGRRQAAYRAR